jgi:hypothetical protein
MSSQHPIATESARSYALAYAIHYSQRDLLGALTAYDQVIGQHPTSPEADYSRSQMHNIARSVIPAQALLAAHVELARLHLQQVGHADPASDDHPSITE